MVAVHVAVQRVPRSQEFSAHLTVVAGGGQMERLHMVACTGAVATVLAAHGAYVAPAKGVLHQHRLQIRFDRLTVNA
jgi:hypothetical protein